MKRQRHLLSCAWGTGDAIDGDEDRYGLRSIARAYRFGGYATLLVAAVTVIALAVKGLLDWGLLFEIVASAIGVWMSACLVAGLTCVLLDIEKNTRMTRVMMERDRNES